MKQTLKRGGGVDFVSWDAWMAEAPSQISISPHALGALAPERLFDLRWAAIVVEQALRRLREECEGKGRLRLFEGLRDYLATEHADISYANLAVSLGVAETVVKKQLHNLRERTDGSCATKLLIPSRIRQMWTTRFVICVRHWPQQHDLIKEPVFLNCYCHVSPRMLRPLRVE